MFKSKICLFFLLGTFVAFSQSDTTRLRGTIKIGKPKDAEISIKAIADFDDFNFPNVNHDFSRDELFQPFPVVDGYSFPFNYTTYFKNNFKSKQIDLKGKVADTVILEVKILANGKAYIKDKSRIMLVNGVPAVYNEKEEAYELNNLHVDCLYFLKTIKQWNSGYVIYPKKDKFKGKIVFKPNKKNVDVTGTITILFSSTPFEN